eukprot:356120-Chlamydomonas_euryale.AAC.2
MSRDGRTPYIWENHIPYIPYVTAPYAIYEVPSLRGNLGMRIKLHGWKALDEYIPYLPSAI